MNEQQFIIEQQKAVERMKETARRSNTQNGNMPPSPHFVKTDINNQQSKPSRTQNNTQNNIQKDTPFGLNLDKFDFPFLDKLRNDKDYGLLLGLILILLCENSDKLLLIALFYILT